MRRDHGGLWGMSPERPAGCEGCAERDAVIAAQAVALAELAAKVERLERLVSRNSGNSSFPPSIDAQPGRKRPRPRRKADGSRSQGKQPGTPGAHLAWSASPDERVR
jgi:transposase